MTVLCGHLKQKKILDYNLRALGSVDVCIYFCIFVSKISVQEGRKEAERKFFFSACVAGNSYGGEINENLINSLQPSLANP